MQEFAVEISPFTKIDSNENSLSFLYLQPKLSSPKKAWETSDNF